MAVGHYPEQGSRGRASMMPAGDTVHIADYRLRYASYRADPDLRALHARSR
jgi:alkaline phosphatase D